MMFVSRCLRLVLHDVLAPSCLRHFLLEFVGTALFLSASLSAVLIRPDLRSAAGLTNQSLLSLGPESGDVPACPLHVVLVFGLSVAMAALCVGGEVHLNPAVSIAMALTLRLRLWRAALYVIGQLLGGVASAGLLMGLTGDVTPAVNQVSVSLSAESQSDRSIIMFVFRCLLESSCTRRLPWKRSSPSSWSWWS